MDSSRVSEGGGERNRRFTNDVIFEILVRLPVISLLRFKCVCKLWYALINSSNFIAVHYSHSHRKKKVPLSIDSCTPTGSEIIGGELVVRTTVSMRFDQVLENLTLRGHVFSILDCTNGVLCFSLSSNNYCLWNPATRQLKHISVPRLDGLDGIFVSSDIPGSLDSGFFFDPVNNSFKVVDITLTVLEGETRAQVKTFSTANNSWTEKVIGLPYRIGAGSPDDEIACISCVKGYMHWFIAIFDHNENLDDMYILCYDMNEERFQRVEMPFCPVPCDVLHLGYKGKLAIFAVHGSTKSRTKIDGWVLNDCGGVNQSWSKLQLGRRPTRDGHDFEVFVKDNDDVVLMTEFEKMVIMEEPLLYSESLASLN